MGRPGRWPVLLLAATLTATADPVERGRYLLHAGGCVTCHTAEDADEQGRLAGGRPLETPFGIFYTPNITPDPETGIGAWSDADFLRALTEGVAPDGSHYYPSFPYTAYTGVRREDLLAIKAYLFSLPPVHRPDRPHQLPWYLSRVLLGPWKWLNFEPGEFVPHPRRSEAHNRGAYLVKHLGHCGECHTPRDWLGGLDPSRWLAGNPQGPEGDAVPNITPHRDSGIGGWSRSDLEYFLEVGMLPDGDFAGGAMGPVIDDNTARLSAGDRRAIAVYLQSLPPQPAEGGQ